MRCLATVVIASLAAMPQARAHGAPRPVHGGPWWSAWNFEQPVVVVNLSMLLLVYLAGLGRLWRRGGLGGAIPRKRPGLFMGGMAVLALALVSPIDVYSDELSWMHMVQHMLLMGVAAPLLVLGSPFLIGLWAFPLSWRRAYGKLRARFLRWKPSRYLLWQPLLVWTIFGLVLWIWHFPPLYEATLYDDFFHDFQHFSFMVAACLFWRVLLDPISRLRLGRVMAVIYLFFTSLHATLLGVFMTLAPKAWYPFYESRAPRWNLSALEDQQLAGLIMWMPVCMMYAMVAAVLLGLWLGENQDDQEQHAPPGPR